MHSHNDFFCRMTGTFLCLVILLGCRNYADAMNSSPLIHLQYDDNTIEIPLEKYLCGVLLAEMPMSFHEEALKAQAVAARTFTWKTVLSGGKHYDGSICTNASCCQGYISEMEYLQKYSDPDRVLCAQKAVAETVGIIAAYDGQLIDASYFSCSGGKTEAAEDVWGKAYPYLVSKTSPGEEYAPCFSDTKSFPIASVQSLLQVSLCSNPENWFQNWVLTEGGGVASVEIEGCSFYGTELRKVFGLRSTMFTVTATDEGVQFHTQGYGHRVGMSQYGANAMANGGETYDQILQYYYEGITLSKIDVYLF